MCDMLERRGESSHEDGGSYGSSKGRLTYAANPGKYVLYVLYVLALPHPWQIEFGKRWPVFGFEKHKGYGTQGHRDAIMQHGIVDIHRRSFLRKMEQGLGGKLPLYESESQGVDKIRHDIQ